MDHARSMNSFAGRLIAWQRDFGRHDLPWQNTRDSYRIWLAEIMLQQTQVKTVTAYYARFLAAYPNLRALAGAPLERVLELWSGLGYYSRARNLHACARCVVEQYDGEFPRSVAELAALPGIGRSTAAAIAAFAYGVRAAILDGNVKRVLARHRGIEGFPGEKAVENRLWQEAQTLLPARDIESYTQALMDMGATICTRATPACSACPVRRDCVARVQGRVGELPTPRPRKPLPQRASTMLVLCHGGTVLLERRPPTGIWGGLWSLPELPPERDVHEYCRTRFGARIADDCSLPTVAHSFTHFKLAITPLRCEVRQIESCAQEPGMLWLALEKAAAAALPAPVKKLLVGMAAQPVQRGCAKASRTDASARLAGARDD
jgi:A/G-specific adenine glycosylase